jgi:transglutaminase-like putative cysteine protease
MKTRKSYVWIPVLLSAAGFTGTAAAALSYGIPAGWLLTLPGAALTAFLAFSMVRMPSRKFWIMAGFSAACLLLFLYFRPALKSSMYVVWQYLAPALADPYDLPFKAPTPPPGASPMPVLICFLSALVWLFTGASSYMFLLALSGIISLFFTLGGLYFGAWPSLPALVLAAAYWISIPVTLGHHSSPDPIKTGGAFLSAVLAGLLLLILVPARSYEQPAFLSRLAEEIISLTDPYDPIFHAGTAYSGIMRGADGHSELGHADGVHYTGQTIVHLSTEDVPHRLYLRSWTGGEYHPNVNQWTVLPDEAYSDVENLFASNQGEWYDEGAWLMEVIRQNQNLAGDLAVYDPRAGKFNSFMHVFRVSGVYIDTPYFFIPYDLSFAMPSAFRYDHAPVSKEGKAYESYLWELPAGSLLTFLRTTESQDAYLLTYEHAEKEYRDFVYAHYLTVPDGLLDNVRKKLPIPKAQTYEEKREWFLTVRQFLRSNYVYDTQPGRTPEGADFISYFLDKAHRGYCTAFASAGVMLLRAGGVPARYVTGLTVSADEVNSSSLVNGFHELDVSDHHAHAWAEVYVDGLGWRPAEMTPGVDGDDNPFPMPPEEKNMPDHPEENNPQPDNGGKQDTQPQNQPDQKQVPQQNQPQVPPRSASMTEEKGFPVLAGLLALFAGGAAFLAYRRLHQVPSLFRAAHNAKKSEDLVPVASYLFTLASWAGYRPPKDSYMEWARHVSDDDRFRSIEQWMSLYMKMRYSGRPLLGDELELWISLTESMRNSCLVELSGLNRLKFLFKPL